MTATMSIRVDEQTQHELAVLTRRGRSRNAVILEAIHQAYRQSVYEQMRRESQALQADPDYRAEIRAAREDMGADDTW